ncbi:MAG TPA: hypothetical protein VNM37_22790 [Candidatus Dormibacteraeota bacterium]|jgi:hypothetical protein|nr:hypothetical protein [Verrucomicrobiae bacterium]HXJ75702.1 hypothetical protein [Candidatus Dormibacteraeota bacterium]
MARQLHILTRQEDVLAAAVITRQRESLETEVIIVDLTEESPDYTALLEQIFAADSVAVW